MIFVTNSTDTKAVGVNESAKSVVVSCENSVGGVSVNLRVDSVYILDFEVVDTLGEAQTLASAIISTLAP